MELMGNQYFIAKNAVIKAERRILKELGFCVHVNHPHKVSGKRLVCVTLKIENWNTLGMLFWVQCNYKRVLWV